MTEFTDITYEVDNGLAWITINRPERYNAFRARTLDELIRAFKMAWASSEVGVICLTGAGEKAFCTGGDQKQRAETGDYGPSETGPVRGGYLASGHPRRAEAGYRGGQRVRDRRRPCSARAVRPDDRRRHRGLRSERSTGRILRRRLRHRLSGAGGRREACSRDLVLVPQVFRGAGSRVGTGQQGGAGRPAQVGGAGMGGRDLDAFADRVEGSQAVVQHRYRTVRIGRPDGVLDPEDVRRDTRSAGRHYRVQRETRPEFAAYRGN